MTAICETLGVARSNVLTRLAGRPSKRMGRPPLPEADLLAEIEAVIKDQSTWGYIEKPVQRAALRPIESGSTAS
jgi:putative transposase